MLNGHGGWLLPLFGFRSSGFFSFMRVSLFMQSLLLPLEGSDEKQRGQVRDYRICSWDFIVELCDSFQKFCFVGE